MGEKKEVTRLLVRMTNGDVWTHLFDGAHTLDTLVVGKSALHWPEDDGETLLQIAAISSFHLTVELRRV